MHVISNAHLYRLLKSADIPFVSEHTKVGSKVDARVQGSQVQVGSTDSLFGLAQRRRAAIIGTSDAGNLQVSGSDQLDLLGQLFGIADNTRVEVNKNTFGTTATRTKGIKGIQIQLI